MVSDLIQRVRKISVSDLFFFLIFVLKSFESGWRYLSYSDTVTAQAGKGVFVTEAPKCHISLSYPQSSLHAKI